MTTVPRDTLARPCPASPRLELARIGKSFPGIVANDEVSLRVEPGEIHAVLGENGAGKSTLVRIVYGLLQADRGEIRFDGRPIAIPSPKAARRLGIGMVFQHFSLFEALDVGENISLGLDEAVTRRTLRSRVDAVLSDYRLPLDLGRIVATLSVGERQRIEIVRALLGRPRLLIMDEPTSVLTPQKAEQLFATLRRLADEGCSILYISHKLDEIRALCDRAMILRAGRVVAACDPRMETTRGMAEAMIGGSVANVQRRPGVLRERADTGVLLAVSSLTSPPDDSGRVGLANVSFAVAAGEVLGIAGIAGNGQSELVAALSGERLAPDPASIRLDGRPIGGLGPAGRRRAGICVLPEERNGHAAVPDLTLADNALLTARLRRPLTHAGLIDRGRTARFAQAVMARFGVKAAGPNAPARSLSGGNLQKFVVGREIEQNPAVLVVAQPTWGVDAGAAVTIRQALIDLAAGGAAVVIVSQDLDELLSISDRIAVLNAGRLSPALDTARVTAETLGLMMGGVHAAASPSPPTVPAAPSPARQLSDVLA